MFYEVVNIWGTLYAPVNPRDNRLYRKEELPSNATIIGEKSSITLTNNTQ